MVRMKLSNRVLPDAFKGKTFHSTTELRSAMGLEIYPFLKDGDRIGVLKSFDDFKIRITYEALRVAADAAVAVLRDSQLRVPYDTGELKASGIAILDFGRSPKGGSRVPIIARGNFFDASTAVQTNYSYITPELVKTVSKIRLQIQYTREGLHGEDIALWAHEELNPHGSGLHPQARRPGTGPKYLEIPFNMLRGSYLRDIRRSVTRVQADIEKVRRKRGRPGQYIVNTRRLGLQGVG